MTVVRIIKNTGIMVLTLGMATGCAMTQKQNEPEAAAPAPVKVEAPAPAPAPMVKEPVPARMYTVARGDNLWSISAMDDVYGDPYQWPLIYKANSDQIKDADLIFPGQEFVINTSAGASEIDAAIQHARNRGAWSLGVTEASDLDYLSR